jgi:CHAT domain-containing protein/tetratricopeptide (TPR) repeat protein
MVLRFFMFLVLSCTSITLASAEIATYSSAAKLVSAAREQAAACDWAGALDTTRRALAAGEKEWKPGAPGFIAVRQDLATYFNRTFAYSDAEREARLALAQTLTAQRLPAERALVEQNLAVALSAQGHTAAADNLFASLVPVLVAGPDRSAAAQAVLAWADASYNAGRSSSGFARTVQAAAIAREGRVTPAVHAMIALRLADAHRRMLRFADADAAADEADRAFEAAGSAAPPARLTLVRASILLERGRLTQALSTLDNLIASNQRGDRCDPTLLADIAHRRATVRIIRREFPEAGADLSRALAALTPLRLGRNPRKAEITYGLAQTSAMERAFDRADQLFTSAAAEFRAVYGGDSEAEAQALMEHAMMLADAGRTAEGLTAAQRALTMLSGPIEQAPLTRAYAQATLGLVSRLAGDGSGAERILAASQAMFDATRGAMSFDLVPGLQALGELALERRDSTQASLYLRRALAIERRWGGESAIALGRTLSRLAAVQQVAGNHKEAMALSEQAVEVLRRRLAIGESRPWNDARAERSAARSILTQDLALITGSTAPAATFDDADAVRRSFQTVQLANATSTGGAIAQMSTRLGAHVAAESASLLSERGDLSNEWRALQDELSGSFTRSRDEGGEGRVAALLDRQTEIASRLVALDAQLTKRDPKLDLLIKSRIVSIADLRTALSSKEAALLFTLGERESYGVVVTASTAKAWRIALNAAEVTALVNRARATLDPARWGVQELPSFDVGAASMLFDAFVAPAMPMLADIDTLLIVPDGALASIPPGVLLMNRAAQVTNDAQYTALPWLVRRFATATYPSAASIVALRSLQNVTAKRETFLGIGAPLFAGNASNGQTRGAVLRGLATRQLADVTMLRQLPPLPDTRKELESMADVIGRGTSRLMLGIEATERAVRTTSLERFGVIVFATHGLVAGELQGYAEPSLVLSPPAAASDDDDGLLASSEVAALKLNADWVILSACNTAADDGTPFAEPLSGLAKSFFYAGARALLVTHWSVDSEAAASLSAGTVRRAFQGTTPAMALQASALDFIDDVDKSLRTHPFFWAPYALIGG